MHAHGISNLSEMDDMTQTLHAFMQPKNGVVAAQRKEDMFYIHVRYLQQNQICLIHVGFSFEKKVETPGLCIKMMHTIYFFIKLFNKM